MANATVTVLEADGVTQTDVVVLDVGRQAAAASKSLTLATEDKTVLDAIAASLAILDNVTQTTAAPTGDDTALVVGIHPDSQLAAVADNADAVAASTSLLNTPVVSKLMGYNGTTYDRLQVDGAKSLKTTNQPSATGGLSVFRSLDLDETEEEVKATAGCLYKIRATNRTTSVRYLKLYNATAANVTVGTTTPIDTIPLPANASDYTVLTESFGGLGLTFDTALSMAVTTGFADNDTGAPGANDVIVSAYYK